MTRGLLALLAADGALLSLLLLGVIQGATEFLPVSSSGHLVLFGHWFGLEREQGLAREVALHLGTLVAVILFCWRDLLALLGAGSRGLWTLVLGSAVVTAAIGLPVEDLIEQHLAHVGGAAGGLLGTALLLAVVAPGDETRQTRTLDQGTLRDALILGLFQSMALVPGISRAGATIVAALLLGFQRAHAVRIAFVMSVPVVGGAVLLKLLEPRGTEIYGEPGLVGGLVVAGGVGLLALRFISVHVDARALRLFALYCLLMASAAMLTLL